MLGVYGVFLLLGQIVLEEARAGLEYRIHLYAPVAPQQVEQMLRWLRSQPLVKEAEFIPPEEAMKGFQKVAGEDFVRAMEGFNPFPPTFRVTFHGHRISSDSVLSFTYRVLEWEEVKEVDYPRKLLEVLEKRAATLRLIGLGLGVIMVSIAFLLIFHTVRLAIFARRLEIRTMELVGATRSFIERPFLLVGLFQGTMSALIAAVLIHAGLALVHTYLLPMPSVLQDWRLKALYGLLIAFGAGVGYFASKLALRRFLGQTLEKLI